MTAELPGHERQGGARRETPDGKGWGRVSGAEPVGCVPAGSYEQCAGLPEMPAHGLGGSVDERGGRLFQLLGTMSQNLGQDRLHAERLDAD